MSLMAFPLTLLSHTFDLSCQLLIPIYLSTCLHARAPVCPSICRFEIEINVSIQDCGTSFMTLMLGKTIWCPGRVPFTNPSPVTHYLRSSLPFVCNTSFFRASHLPCLCFALTFSFSFSLSSSPEIAGHWANWRAIGHHLPKS